MDNGMSRGPAITGASFYFARPTGTAMRPSNTIGSGIGNGIILYASRHPSMVDIHELFKTKRDSMRDDSEDLEMNHRTSQTETADSTVKEIDLEDRFDMEDEAVIRRASRQGRRTRLSEYGRTITMETTTSTLKNNEDLDEQDLRSRSSSSSSGHASTSASAASPAITLTSSPLSPTAEVPENLPLAPP